MSEWVICVSLYKCQQKLKFKKKMLKGFCKLSKQQASRGHEEIGKSFVRISFDKLNTKKRGKKRVTCPLFCPSSCFFAIFSSIFFTVSLFQSTVFDNLKRLGFLKCTIAFFFRCQTFSGIRKKIDVFWVKNV